MIRKLRLWKEKHYSNTGCLYLKVEDYPYVKGVAGADIKLTLLQKIQILFCKGVSVFFIGKDVSK